MSGSDELDRLKDMNEDGEGTWILDPNDVKAIKWAINAIAGLKTICEDKEEKPEGTLRSRRFFAHKLRMHLEDDLAYAERNFGRTIPSGAGYVLQSNISVDLIRRFIEETKDEA